MQNLKILNSRDTKHLLEKLNAQYGFPDNKNILEYIFLMNKDNRIYIISKDISKIFTEGIKIDSIGLYFGELYRESVRLSIDGAQIVGREATRNIVYLDYPQMISWIK